MSYICPKSPYAGVKQDIYAVIAAIIVTVGAVVLEGCSNPGGEEEFTILSPSVVTEPSYGTHEGRPSSRLLGSPVVDLAYPPCLYILPYEITEGEDQIINDVACTLPADWDGIRYSQETNTLLKNGFVWEIADGILTWKSNGNLFVTEDNDFVDGDRRVILTVGDKKITFAWIIEDDIASVWVDYEPQRVIPAHPASTRIPLTIWYRGIGISLGTHFLTLESKHSVTVEFGCFESERVDEDNYRVRNCVRFDDEKDHRLLGPYRMAFYFQEAAKGKDWSLTVKSDGVARDMNDLVLDGTVVIRGHRERVVLGGARPETLHRGSLTVRNDRAVAGGISIQLKIDMVSLSGASSYPLGAPSFGNGGLEDTVIFIRSDQVERRELWRFGFEGDDPRPTVCPEKIDLTVLINEGWLRYIRLVGDESVGGFGGKYLKIPICP